MLARSPGSDQFSAMRVSRGMGSRSGIDRNRERAKGGRERSRHWLQTPWRRRDASQLLAKHILSRRVPVPRAPGFFMVTAASFAAPMDSSHKISSSSRSTSRQSTFLPIRPSLIVSRFLMFLCRFFFTEASTIVLIVEM